jgi:integrase
MAKRSGNGEGGITYREDGRYMGRYTVETPAGPKRRVVYGKTRKEAHEKLIEALADRDRGLIFEGENQTLSDYLGQGLNGSVKGSVKPSTFESYECMIRNHIRPSLGHKRLKTLAPVHVQYFYQSKLDEGWRREPFA